jgi:hypothetical protein
MTIKSVFDHATEIPKNYTCFGSNVNPPLFIDEVPEEAKSLVLLFEDLNSAPLLTHLKVLLRDWQITILMATRARVQNILKEYIITATGCLRWIRN